MAEYKQPTRNMIHRDLKNGTRDEIFDMLQRKTELNFINEDAYYMGDTVLHAVLRNEKLIEKHVIEILTILLSQGVDPNIANKNEHTSLHLAVERRMKDVVDLLLKFQANVCAVDEIGNSIAHFFITDEYEKCKLALLYPIMNMKENREAKERCSVNFLEFLISKNVNFDLQNKGGTSALYSAIMYQLLHILPTLFEHTQDIHFAEGNKTLLHYFLNERSRSLSNPCFDYNSKYATNCVSVLLDRKVPILKCEKYGCTLISDAIRKREKTDIIETLISYYLSNCDHVRIATTLHNELISTCEFWSDLEGEFFMIVLSDLEKMIADNKYKIQQNRYTPTKNWAKKRPLESSNEGDNDWSTKLTLTENQLHTLAKQRNYEGSKDDLHNHVGDLIKGNDCEIDAKNDRGKSALHVAAGYGNARMISTLIQLGADVNNRDNNMKTPLHDAAMMSEAKDAIDLLITNGADVNAVDSTGETPLHLAISQNNVTIVQSLLEHGASVSCRNKCQQTPLLRVRWTANEALEIVDLLVSKGADINAKDQTDETPFYLAVSNNNVGVVQLLLRNGASINCRNKFRLTPLHRALLSKNVSVKMIELLLTNGAEMNTIDYRGDTPLYTAILKNNLPIVQLLVEHGASMTWKNKYGQTPLDFAVNEGSMEIVELLLVYGAKVNAKNHKGETSLHLAVSKNNLPIVRLLVENGAFVSCRNKQGHTPLHLAVINGAADIVELLLANGEDPNVKDNEGNRPLHHVSNQWTGNYSDKRMLKMLLEKGARVGVLNDRGQRTAGLTFRDDHLMEYGGSRVACLEDPRRDEVFANRHEYLREIQELQSIMVGTRQSLFDFLLMHPKLRCSHMKSEELQKLIGSPRLCELFPIYHCIILARYQEAVTRKTLEESAQQALYNMTGMQLPDSIDKVLAQLENEDLVNIVQANFGDDAYVNVNE